MDESKEPTRPQAEAGDHDSQPATANDDPHSSEDPRPEEREDDLRAGDMLPKAVRQRLETLIPDLVKKTVTAGMGAVVSTEDGIRRLTKDLSLPKDVASYVATTAGATKDELLRIVAKEVREFLESVNLSEEIAKMLTTLSFEVKTEVRFIPNDERIGKGGVKPDVRSRVRLKNSDDRPRRRRRRRRRPRGDSQSDHRGDSRSDNDDGSQGAPSP